MDFLATARRLEAIQAEATRDLASESEPVAGGWMAANGQGSYLNKAVGLGFDTEPSADDVGRVERFFGSRGIEPRIELTAFAPVGFLRTLAERGFVLQEFEHTLVLPVNDRLAGLTERLPAGTPQGVRLEPLDPADAARVRTFVVTSASGFVAEGASIPDIYLTTGVKRRSRRTIMVSSRSSGTRWPEPPARLTGAASCRSSAPRCSLPSGGAASSRRSLPPVSSVPSRSGPTWRASPRIRGFPPSGMPPGSGSSWPTFGR